MSHQQDLDITIDQISKIEGHAEIDVKIRSGEVQEVKLKVNENKRFYEQAVRGRPFHTVPQLVSRICGTCSVAHLNCSLEAVEKAVDITISDQSRLFRQLTMDGLMIRDHAMHLYLFSLPDVLGKDSVLDLEGPEKELLHQAFHVKSAGNALSKMILGRAIHGIYSQVGGYSVAPTTEQIQPVIKELRDVRPYVLDLLQIYLDCPFDFRRTTHNVALVSDQYDYLDGMIHSSRGLCVHEEHYGEHLTRVVIPYSQSAGYEFEGMDYMVGALPRMNLNRAALHPHTIRDAKKFISVFPSNNIFHNNLAQGIEILHGIDHALDILEGADFKKEAAVQPAPLPKNTDSTGVAVIEAPRGNLYYMVSIKPDGSIQYANIVTPSAQNQINMEDDLKLLVTEHLDKSKEKITFEMEKLIRAYDPCFSCASHFLKVNWT
ncbi:nickel-dependent hydrogenase large subunit [Candidatus Micrarchaeota archaeon]|nr:nickel-dependent hydrogenase large subunit [Candidatus Micrarchaeota archaeon]